MRPALAVLAILEFEHAVGEALEKGPVVGDEEHRSLEPGQGLDQHLLGLQIQVVGRFVEHEKVRRVEQHPRHDQA